MVNILILILSLCLSIQGVVKHMDYYTQNCCGGVLYNGSLHESVIHECCGNTTFNPKAEVCCDDNEIKPVPGPGETYECCAGKVFDYYKELCCEGTIYLQENITTECCGGIVHDTATSLCCDKRVQPRGELGARAKCCGRKVFDAKQQLCCEEDIFENPTEVLECCGNKTFDKRKELCCLKNNISREVAGPLALCCEELVYDSEKQVCCNGKALPKLSIMTFCCGEETHEVNETICCEGKIHPRPNIHTACCGVKTYNIYDFYCCGRRLFPLGDNLYPVCCTDKGTIWSDISGNLHDMDLDKHDQLFHYKSYENDVLNNKRRKRK